VLGTAKIILYNGQSDNIHTKQVIFVTFLHFLHPNWRTKLVGDENMSIFSNLFGPSVPSLKPAEVQEKLKNGRHPFLLDVREKQELRDGYISGAKLIPLGQLNKRMRELPKDREIVCVCRSGNRSRSAAKQLVAAGYSASNMSGGMLAWKRSNLPVKKDR
jgi:rhodanese-related sulfurtransferase